MFANFRSHSYPQQSDQYHRRRHNQPKQVGHSENLEEHFAEYHNQDAEHRRRQNFGIRTEFLHRQNSNLQALYPGTHRSHNHPTLHRLDRTPPILDSRLSLSRKLRPCFRIYELFAMRNHSRVFLLPTIDRHHRPGHSLPM